MAGAGLGRLAGLSRGQQVEKRWLSVRLETTVQKIIAPLVGHCSGYYGKEPRTVFAAVRAGRWPMDERPLLMCGRTGRGWSELVGRLERWEIAKVKAGCVENRRSEPPRLHRLRCRLIVDDTLFR